MNKSLLSQVFIRSQSPGKLLMPWCSYQEEANAELFMPAVCLLSPTHLDFFLHLQVILLCLIMVHSPV